LVQSGAVPTRRKERESEKGGTEGRRDGRKQGKRRRRREGKVVVGGDIQVLALNVGLPDSLRLFVTETHVMTVLR
jgi:hypothetical protein